MRNRQIPAALLTACWLFSSADAAEPNSGALKYLTDLSGMSLRAIEAALPELRRRRPDWSNYRIEIAESDISFIVEFWLPENETIITNPLIQGPEEDKIAYRYRDFALDVELDKQTLQVKNVIELGRAR